jgi:uncharacterized protein (DUF58 family)
VRSLGILVLTTSSLFLILMAVMLNSPALFYMSTAMVAMIGACRLQAWMSVRGLRFERLAPPTCHVGELVNVELVVWSERRLKRPLVSVNDELPSRLIVIDRTPSLPIAPSYDQPVVTRYSFRPMRRGRFTLKELTAVGTDALGMVTMSRRYETEPAQITVYPRPLAVHAVAMPSSGYGGQEVDSGRSRGSGIESRGIREYQVGDPLRHVHWATSARRGALMVKEFETGSSIVAAFAPQRALGSAVGEGAVNSFEAMCGHLAYLSEEFLRRGARVLFPTMEQPTSDTFNEALRRREVYELLTDATANAAQSLATEIDHAAPSIPEGSALYVLVCVQDPALPDALRRATQLQRFCLLYDPADFGSSLPAAVEPAYVARLRDAGASVIFVPIAGGLA